MARTVAGSNSDRLLLFVPRRNGLGCSEHRTESTMGVERHNSLLGWHFLLGSIILSFVCFPFSF